ncbi:MAG: Tetratricopeptide repeat protein [Candidatus Udaeobacter sp.]|nr:MAG: Tetratricopeptide repeat protein [Candidatus Udaeobacter sp.]
MATGSRDGKKSAYRVPAQRATTLGVSAFLVAITWLVFGETVHHPSVSFDDPLYVFENPQIITGLTLTGVLWAFRHSHAGNWHPLTSISHMLDCQLFGQRAGCHHFTNVLLHTIGVVLLFLLFQKMTGAFWRSAFVAAVFAIHPLRVESVAWIAERKDVLSGVFFMLTLGAYVRYVREPSGIRYLAVGLLFALGLMSKPMLVTLPLVLLLLDYWPLERFTNVSPIGSKRGTWSQQSIGTRLILEKIPLLALSAVSSLITLFAQRQAVSSAENLPLLGRISNALVSYVAYIWQMVWPIQLALVYPHPAIAYSQPEYRLALWKAAGAAAFLAGVTAVVLAFGKKHRYLITGWFWYLGMLMPVIGIIQVGAQARADRYTYLPQIGLYLIVTWTIADLSMAWRYRRQILVAAAAIVIAALMWLAWTQDTYWRDSETLWTHTLAVTSHNDVAHAALADFLLKRDRVDEGISHSEEALKIQPRNANAHDTLALGLFRSGRVNEAVTHWKESLKIRPDGMNAQSNLAWVFATSPDASLRDGAKAVELAKKAIKYAGNANDTNVTIILRTLAAGYAETGRFAEAIETAQQASQMAFAQGNTALAEDLQSNIAHYRRGLPLRDPEAINKTR